MYIVQYIVISTVLILYIYVTDLVLYILDPDYMNPPGVHGDRAAHGQHRLRRLLVVPDILLEHLDVLRVEEDVDLLLLVVGVLDNPHVIVEVAGHLALHADKRGPAHTR